MSLVYIYGLCGIVWKWHLIDSSISESGAQSSEHFIIQNVFKSISNVPTVFNSSNLALKV